MLPALELSFAQPGHSGDGRELAVLVSSGQALRQVRFRSSGPKLKHSGDVLLCLGLVPAMELGCDLVLGSTVDAGLLSNAEQIQTLLCSWYPGYRRIRIVAAPGRTEYQAGRGAAVFFSGGVDSSFSLAEARERLSGLVTVIGADVDPADAEEARHLESVARSVGCAYGLETVLVETNLRDVFDPLIGWVEYHGAALAAIRHMLADRFENLLIASSADESSWKRRWGSHPELDPLFGTEGARIEHHGLVHRLAKIERLLKEPDLLANLRVCDYRQENCGVCEDCTFMVKSLGLLRAFDRAKTFSAPALGARRLVVTGEGSKSDLVNLRQRALDDRDPALAREIEQALDWYERKKRFHSLLPLPETKRRFKRLKRQYRYWRASRRR